MMWSNIGRIGENRSHMELLPDEWRSTDSTREQRRRHDGLVLYADCRSTNLGLFAGLLFFVTTTIVVIVYYIMGGSDECVDVKNSSYLNNVYESVMHAVNILVTIAVSLFHV